MSDDPLVEDLDLYSTATDLDGIALPIALADRQVFEFRHRNVFHFKKRGEAHDFTPDNNPFLAFVSRCTSAFPFAFEPMTLDDIFPVIQRLPAHAGREYTKEETRHWEAFYADYLRDVDLNVATEFRYRPFGDGGYLDNRPFSYAINAVLTRHSDLPVDRKLVYVEPSPENIGQVQRKRKDASDRPDAVENSLSALSTLPRYETIREDLERVHEWNRNVRRVRRMIDFAREAWTYRSGYREEPAFHVYLRLRLSSVTDVLMADLTRALQYDHKSAYGEALRAVGGKWRDRNVQTDEEKHAFLDAYDRAYLERAIQFLYRKLRDETLHSPRLRGFLSTDREQVTAAKVELHRLTERPLPDVTPEALLKLDEASAATVAKNREADLRFVVDPQEAATRTGIDPACLYATTASLEERVVHLLDVQGWSPLIQEADGILRAHFAPTLQTVREHLTPLMERFGGWDQFESQDSLIFPLLFGTTVGEVDPIDIIRISPEDVASIKGVNDQSGNRVKLKGEQLGAFGGFLDRRWREHDMLWGRLHAAERLISAILADSDPTTISVRDIFIREAQEAIALEWSETNRKADAAATIS